MFKLIAHRGASCEAQENTLDALRLAADLGADAVECDPRYTKDGHLVLFHDDDLSRMANDNRAVSDLTLEQLREALSRSGMALTTQEELERQYTGSAPILFDLSFYPTDDVFFRHIAALPFPVIAGVHTPAEARLAVNALGGARVLAFMRKPEDFPLYGDAGCGILRLWEGWLDRFTPAMLKERYPQAEVWIMAHDPAVRHPLFCMNGSDASIDRAIALGADGMLLNDIRRARAHLCRECGTIL